MVAETVVAGAAGVSASTVIDVLREGDKRSTQLLEKIYDSIHAGNLYNARQRQRTLEPVDLSVQVGVTDGIGQVATLDGHRRGSHLLISGATAGDEFALMVGSNQKLRFIMGSTDPKEIDLPMMFGSQIYLMDLTTLDDATWRAYLWVYSDQNGE